MQLILIFFKVNLPTKEKKKYEVVIKAFAL